MSRERVSLEPGFVLHQRPYRESSRLLEVFTREHGRVGLVARGVSGGRSARAALLQALQPLLLSWVDGGELGTLSAAESGGAPLALGGDRLFCAWYLNELLLRVLPRRDPHPDLYAFYLAALASLAQGERALAPIMREFELELVSDLGYGLPSPDDLDAGQHYDCEDGDWIPVAQDGWSGAQLQAVARRDWSQPGVLQAARRLLNRQLAPLIGGRPLRTPQLFVSLRRLQAANAESQEG